MNKFVFPIFPVAVSSCSVVVLVAVASAVGASDALGFALMPVESATFDVYTRHFPCCEI